MNDKHTPTPGPWKVIEVGQSSAGPDGVPVCEVYSMDARVRVCEFVGEADARLIAAAPDLLEALEAIVKQRAMLKQRIGTDLDIAINRARAAISRASGEQT